MVKKVYYLPTLLLVVFFFIFVWKNTYNFPFLDDFDNPLDFLLIFERAEGFLASLKEFFEFHSDHKLLNLRVEIFSYLTLFGPLNLQIIILFNNLFIFFSFLILTKFVTRGSFKALVVFVGALFLFSNSYFTAIYFAHVSANYGPVVFLGLAGLLFFKKDLSWSRLFLIFVLCTFSFFSFGNGIVSFFVFALLLVYTRQYQKAIIFCLAAVLIVLVFFIGYERAGYLKEYDLGFEAIFVKLLGILNLFGSFVLVLPVASRLSLYIGIIILLIGVLFFWLDLFGKEKRDRDQVLLWAALLFFWGTMALIVHGRVNSYQEVGESLTDRYRFYSLFGFVTLFFIVTNRLETKWKNLVSVILVGAGVLFSLYSYFGRNEENTFYKKLMIATENNYYKFGKGMYYYQGVGGIRVTGILDSVYAKEYLKPNDNLFSDLSFELPVSSVNMNFEQRTIPRKFGADEFNDYLLYAEVYDLEFLSEQEKGAYLVLADDKGKGYLYPFKQNQRSGKNFFKGGVGATTELNLGNVPNGEYKLMVMIYETPNNYKVYDSGKVYTNNYAMN